MAKYRTMMGREIDMEKLASANELMPAVSNVKINARGDELGPGGQIIRKREDVVAAYYESNPNAKPILADPATPKEVKKEEKKTKKL